MELLYNPDSMLEEEIKATFVARHNLIRELVALIKQQPDGAGVQHVVIIAPRGMGKTTVLLMLQFAVRDGELAPSWQAIRFAEESYHIYDLADFWIEVLNRLSAETKDSALLERTEKLRTQYRDNDDLQEAALALIKDWRRRYQKRLLLLIDNFDMILEQINDERDNARLRDVLMNDGTIMLLGCATTFFDEARTYDQPLYNFFKIVNLENLRFAQMQELLRRRASIDRIPNFEEKLKANESRLRVLEYFTGGNPRLVLMLYRIVTQSDVPEVRRGLEKLLDQVTPYYKAKIETLPAQQRKILDHIARVSGQTHEGLTPSQISEATRLKPNQVSAQLKRLSELGYLRTANLRSRNSYYTLSEPLYAIWHQMRFGRDSRQRMQWLVDFLKIWYDSAEMSMENNRLDKIFHEHLIAGRLLEARDALEHRRYLAEAMDGYAKDSALESVICNYLEIKDFDVLKKELLTPALLRNLSSQTLNLLLEAKCISEQELDYVKTLQPSSAEARQDAEAVAITELAIMAIRENRLDEALQHLNHALELNPESNPAWAFHGIALAMSERYEEAIQSFDRALALNPNVPQTWYNKGTALAFLGRYEEALENYNRALSLEPSFLSALVNRGIALNDLRRYQEAIDSYNRALEIEPQNYEALNGRGLSLSKLQRYEEAVESYEQAIKIRPHDYRSWFNRGCVLSLLNKHEEAIESYDEALKIEPDSYQALTNRGAALAELNRNEESLESFDRALKITSDPFAWFNRGMALHELERHEEEVESYDKGLKIKPDEHQIWLRRGKALHGLGKNEEAVASYNRVLEINPNIHEARLQRGIALSALGKYEEALASYDHLLAIKPDSYEAWVNRGTALSELGRYEEAIESYDRAREGGSVIAPLAYLMKFNMQVRLGKFEAARREWKSALKSAEGLYDEGWDTILSMVLIGVARQGHLELIRRLISESDLEEQLLPLARALDYLLNNDEAIIEKLSPEVQGIVEDIANNLHDDNFKTVRLNTKRGTKKLKSKPRRRKKKQLQ